MPRTIGNPLSWTVQAVAGGGRQLGAGTAALAGSAYDEVTLRRIGTEDIREALRKGLDDFGAFRSYVVFLCLIYPVAGLCLVWLTARQEMLPLVFPLISGFALVGPIATVGLQELSRRRERGLATSLGEAFAPIFTPAFGPILALSAYLAALFVLWVVAARAIWLLTLGPDVPDSAAAFLADVVTTPAGWAMIVAGVAAGFVFAVAALAVSVLSFSLVLDRQMGVSQAVATSVRFTRENPQAVATWGAVVAGLLILGAIPVLIGLAFVLPL
ncbi:MAG: DUF2189 domain-containing protein, partial [Rhodobacteraceae bacterium]|nr:DUF2189 domain-containing protein [Paracoccaceae bacterium]